MDKVTALKENVNPFVLGLASLLCVAIMFCNFGTVILGVSC